MNWVRLTVISTMLGLLAGCVTTVKDPLSDEVNLQEAENTYVQIAYAHISRGNYQEAKRPLEKALELNDESGGAYIGLALIYAREDEPELAEKNFKLAMRYDETPEARYQYATWLYNQGRLKESYKQMNRVTQNTTYGRRSQAFEILGIISMRMEKPEQAVEHFEKAITLNRQQASAYINLAQAHLTLDREVAGYRAYQGFVRLVKIEMARHNAATLWLGVQLAHLNNDLNAEGSYSLQLEKLYPSSNEYLAYQSWKKEQNSQ